MISIIIPVLNESKHIDSTLSHLLKYIHQLNNIEILIIDGGSTDNSIQIINSFITSNKEKTNSIHLHNSPKGRAKQMNYGASLAKGNILYFLHADGKPPKHFDKYINQEINRNNQAGCFCMKFDWNHWWLFIASQLTKINHKSCRGGDQSLFITKQLFQSLNGYNEEYIIYEDNILIKELYNKKQFTVIKKWLTTSARLYKEIGLWRLQYYYFVIYFKKWRGAHPNDLYKFYKSKVNPKRKTSI